ncbi:MAG: hypothetical protein M1823_002220 [Watsoniomyces obsoletus]|nr:MAG: hypothetical protein M1823_002220 [Watsoniomyces obsoletus]
MNDLLAIPWIVTHDPGVYAHLLVFETDGDDGTRRTESPVYIGSSAAARLSHGDSTWKMNHQEALVPAA